MKRTCLTIDIDCTDYISGNINNEMDTAFPEIKKIFDKLPEVKATWYIRIDSQIEKLKGRSDWILHQYASEFAWLRDKGHELGWHHHSYQLINGKWVQDTNESMICSDLERYGQLARSLGLETARMGWGFHTNATMQKLARLGFQIDSSAIPRPVYSWELSKKDWTPTTNAPYYPSVSDYRVPGEPHIDIIELPITTVTLPVPADTEEDVKRYINPCYRSQFFRAACSSVAEVDPVVMVAHPYEWLPASSGHELLSFSPSVLEENIRWLAESGSAFFTVSGIKSEVA